MLKSARRLRDCLFSTITLGTKNAHTFINIAISVFVLSCTLAYPCLWVYNTYIKTQLSATHCATSLILLYSLFVSSSRVASLRMCQTDMLNAALSKCFPFRSSFFLFRATPFCIVSLLLCRIIIFLNRRICAFVVVACVSCIYTRAYKFGFIIVIASVLVAVGAKHFCGRYFLVFSPETFSFYFMIFFWLKIEISFSDMPSTSHMSKVSLFN